MNITICTTIDHDGEFLGSNTHFNPPDELFREIEFSEHSKDNISSDAVIGLSEVNFNRTYGSSVISVVIPEQLMRKHDVILNASA